MAILSKSEILFLQGQKSVSKSYEYKLKSAIKKKLSKLVDMELPLISSLFPTLNFNLNSSPNPKTDLTKNGQALRPFESQIPGSNPGRSITPSFLPCQGFVKFCDKMNKITRY